MKSFLGCFFALVLSVGIFFGVAGIMGSQHGRGVIDEIKSWGNPAVETTTDDNTTEDVDNTVNDEIEQNLN